MFNPLLKELLSRIKAQGGEPVAVPEGLEEKNSLKGDGVIRSWLWQVPGFRRWRITRLDAGEKLQVLNSVAYPEYTNDQPLLGIDLLWFGISKKLVAVLDFQPLIQEELYFHHYFQGLKAVRERFPELSKDESMHSFDPNRYFSPSLLFCRGGFEQLNGPLPIAFKEFLDCYLNLGASTENTSLKLSSSDVAKLQADYDTYSAERDPAHGLFISYFGHEWTERYLKEFLFPLKITLEDN